MSSSTQLSSTERIYLLKICLIVNLTSAFIKSCQFLCSISLWKVFLERGVASLLSQVTASKTSIFGQGSTNWLDFQRGVNSLKWCMPSGEDTVLINEGASALRLGMNDEIAFLVFSLL